MQSQRKLLDASVLALEPLPDVHPSVPLRTIYIQAHHSITRVRWKEHPFCLLSSDLETPVGSMVQEAAFQPEDLAVRLFESIVADTQ